MIVFALTFEGDAQDWFNDLWDESIDSMAKFFEKFLLHWHEGTVEEIEQLAKEYDALLPRTQPDSEEEIHDEHFEDQSKQFKEQIIEDLIDEAVQGPLVEDITEELPEIAKIKKNGDMELPQIYVIENIPEPLHAEDLDLPQVHNMIFVDQLEQRYDGGLYLSPINQWIEASCAYSSCPNVDSFFYPNHLVFQFSWLHEQTVRHLCLMIILSLFLSLTKQRRMKFGMEQMLEWLHWLYAYT